MKNTFSFQISIECQADMLWEYWKSLTRDIALIYLFILQTSIEAHVRLIDILSLKRLENKFLI